MVNPWMNRAMAVAFRRQPPRGRRTSSTERPFASGNGGAGEKSGDVAASGSGTRQAGIDPSTSLCQLNNHPDYRLRMARERLQRAGQGGIGAGGGVAASTGGHRVPPRNSSGGNPVRSSGTTSGAAAEDRLRAARRMALINANRPSQRELPRGPSAFQRPPRKRGGIRNKTRCDRPVKENGLSFEISENSTRPDDGTSSGAKADERLRLARRRAMEKLKFPDERMAAPGKPPARGTCNEVAKEHGLGVSVSENPIRSSDATSSGALAEDRLRMARRRALESMSKPPPMSGPSSTSANDPEGFEGVVKEHDLAFSVTENAIRRNDGTSSAAKADERLLLARRRAMESMAGQASLPPSPIQPPPSSPNHPPDK